MPHNTDVFNVLEAWEYGAVMDLGMAQTVDDGLDVLMELELAEIEGAFTSAPSWAQMRLARLFSFVNAAASKLPALLRRLERWIQRLQSLLNALGKKVGATGFSVGVSAGGLSFDLSFPIV